MRYQVRVAGRIFEGSDVNTLLKCAVQARKEMIKNAESSISTAPSTSERIRQTGMGSLRHFPAA